MIKHITKQLTKSYRIICKEIEVLELDENTA